MNYILTRFLFSNFTEIIVLFILKLIFMGLRYLSFNKLHAKRLDIFLYFEFAIILGCLIGFKNYISQSFYKYGKISKDITDQANELATNIDDPPKSKPIFLTIYEFFIIPIIQVFVLVVLTPVIIKFLKNNLDEDLLNYKKNRIQINILIPLMMILCVNIFKVQLFQYPSYVDFDRKIGEKYLIFPLSQLVAFIIFIVVYSIVNNKINKYETKEFLIDIIKPKFPINKILKGLIKKNKNQDHPMKNSIDIILKNSLNLIQTNNSDKYDQVLNMLFSLKTEMEFYRDVKEEQLMEINTLIKKIKSFIALPSKDKIESLSSLNEYKIKLIKDNINFQISTNKKRESLETIEKFLNNNVTKRKYDKFSEKLKETINEKDDNIFNEKYYALRPELKNYSIEIKEDKYKKELNEKILMFNSLLEKNNNIISDFTATNIEREKIFNELKQDYNVNFKSEDVKCCDIPKLKKQIDNLSNLVNLSQINKKKLWEINTYIAQKMNENNVKLFQKTIKNNLKKGNNINEAKKQISINNKFLESIYKIVTSSDKQNIENKLKKILNISEM